MSYKAVWWATTILVAIITAIVSVHTIERHGYFALIVVAILMIVVAWIMPDIASFVAKKLGKK